MLTIRVASAAAVVIQRHAHVSHACCDEVMSILEPRPGSLSQRELRNESGRVLRAVSEGQAFVRTNSGVTVGRIVPLDAPVSVLPVVRPAKRRGGWAALGIARATAGRDLAVIMDDLRADRL